MAYQTNFFLRIEMCPTIFENWVMKIENWVMRIDDSNGPLASYILQHLQWMKNPLAELRTKNRIGPILAAQRQQAKKALPMMQYNNQSLTMQHYTAASQSRFIMRNLFQKDWNVRFKKHLN